MKSKFFEQLFETIQSVSPSQWEYYIANPIMLGAPCNPLSQKIYSGVNSFNLYLTCVVRNYESNMFATFNQIKKAKGKIKKGSLHAKVFHYVRVNFVDDKIIYENHPEFDEQEARYIEKAFSVFNFDDVEGIDLAELLQWSKNQTKDDPEIYINNVVTKGNLVIKKTTRRSAFYSPVLDYVGIQDINAFTSTNAYYSTLFHEIAHWTGHKSRIDRKLLESHDNKSSYAFEELIAEISAAILCTDFQLNDQFINSCAYLAGYLQKENSKEQLYNAFKKAMQVISFLKKYQPKEVEPV